MHNKVGIAWIDNDSARYAILKGNSDSFSLRALCRVNQQIELEAPSSVWYERASSYSNPSDGPSRKLVSQTASLLEPWIVMRGVTPDHLIQAIMDLHSKPLSLLYALTNGGQPPVRSVENSNSWSHPRSRKRIGVRLFIVPSTCPSFVSFLMKAFSTGLVFLNSELPPFCSFISKHTVDQPTWPTLSRCQPPVRSVENSNSWSHPRSRKRIGVRLFIVHQHVQALFHFWWRRFPLTCVFELGAASTFCVSTDIYIYTYVYIPWFILSVSPSDSQLAILINRTVFMLYTIYQLYVVAGELSLSKTRLWQKSSGASGPYHPPLWRCHSTVWGYRRWVLASTIVALSQHGSKAGSNDRSVNGISFCACMARQPWNSGRGLPLRGVYPTPSRWRTRTARSHMPPRPYVGRGGESSAYVSAKGSYKDIVSRIHQEYL